LFLTDVKKVDENFSPRTVQIGTGEYALERADTYAKREKGLGGRESMCAECGMLFIFETPGQYAFWMKDMRFSLDIIWLSGETVVFVAHDVSPDFSGIIEPPVSADRVIELNAGAAKDLVPGEKVIFSY
jgi:hypothetical protein